MKVINIPVKYGRPLYKVFTNDTELLNAKDWRFVENKSYDCGGYFRLDINDDVYLELVESSVCGVAMNGNVSAPQETAILRAEGVWVFKVELKEYPGSRFGFDNYLWKTLRERM